MAKEQQKNRVKFVAPANPKRVAYEERKEERKEQPVEVTLETIYQQNQQILANQEYIIELMRKK